MPMEHSSSCLVKEATAPVDPMPSMLKGNMCQPCKDHGGSSGAQPWSQMSWIRNRASPIKKAHTQGHWHDAVCVFKDASTASLHRDHGVPVCTYSTCTSPSSWGSMHAPSRAIIKPGGVQVAGMQQGASKASERRDKRIRLHQQLRSTLNSSSLSRSHFHHSQPRIHTSPRLLRGGLQHHFLPNPQHSHPKEKTSSPKGVKQQQEIHQIP